jgi:hypothetical protein
MFDRKKELRKWFIDHPNVTPTKLAEGYGKSSTVANNYLFHLPSAPSDFVDVCRKAGIPEDLLPEPTRTKTELLAEVVRLRAENEALRGQGAA